MNIFNFDMAKAFDTTPIKNYPVRPARPEMPTNGEDFEPWRQRNLEHLRAWFRWCHGKNQKTGTEWDAFCTLQYVAEQESEGL